MRVPEPPSRVLARLLRGCAPISQHPAAPALGDAFAFASRLPASQALRRFARSSRRRVEQGQFVRLHIACQRLCKITPAAVAPFAAADKMAKLTAALCLSCASAMVYTNPTSVTPRRTGVSFLPVKLQSGNSKETFAKFVAHTHRERSAQHDAGVVPRHRSAARFHICRA